MEEIYSYLLQEIDNALHKKKRVPQATVLLVSSLKKSVKKLSNAQKTLLWELHEKLTELPRINWV